MYTSAAAFTDSTTPATSFCARVLPTSGRSTNTTSPRASWAWVVMPTVAMSPSTVIHSWSSVYLVVMRSRVKKWEVESEGGRLAQSPRRTGFAGLLVASAFQGEDAKRRRGSSSVITVWHEGQRHHFHRHHLATHEGVHPG